MIIESRANERVKEARKLLLRKERKESGLHLIEGDKLVREAVSSGAVIVSCFVEDGFAFTPPENAITYDVTRAVLESLCESQTPQGVVAVVRTPELAPPEEFPAGLIVVLDGVQDPGNVGTVIRTADAFGCDGVILLTGCADPYSVKTLRSSMGAVFRLPVWCTDVETLHVRLRDAGLPLYGAALRDDTADVRALPLHRCAIAIGSEGRGLTAQVLALCDRTVRIPMEAHCESLNAAMAAAVLLWEAYR